MKINDALEIGGNTGMYVLTITQTKEIFQIISLVLSILISLLIITGKVINWWKKAKEDGKITKEEIEEIVNNVGYDIDKINEDVDKIKNNSKNKRG